MTQPNSFSGVGVPVVMPLEKPFYLSGFAATSRYVFIIAGAKTLFPDPWPTRYQLSPRLCFWAYPRIL